MTKRAEPPPYDCPKCGHDRWGGPIYRPASRGFHDCLVWKCGQCGHFDTTPCLDALKKESQ